MKDILEVVELKLESEQKAKQIFEQNNSNTLGAATDRKSVV